MPSQRDVGRTTTEGANEAVRRFNLNMSVEAYEQLQRLGRENRRSMTEIVRLALSLVGVALEPRRNAKRQQVDDLWW
jgi:hypothetical protein